MGKNILIIGVLSMFLYVIPNAYCAVTYYEIWRSESVDPSTAIRLQAWRESTSYDDYSGTPGQHYYYWIRVVTAETEQSYNYMPGSMVTMYQWLTCPTAAERGEESPIRLKVAMTTYPSPLYSIGDLTCRIREDDVVVDDTMVEWTQTDVTVNPGEGITWEMTWTNDIVLGDFETSATAEVYSWVRYLHISGINQYNLEDQTSNVNVSLRDYSDDAPSTISASQGTYTDRVHITWSPASGNSQLTAAAMGWKAIPDTDPPSPNPMTWATEPYETSTSSISMIATTASDPTTPISYYFDYYDSPTGGSGGTDSSWQSGTTYTNSGLSTNHQYGYRVKAKDGNGNETSYSSVSYDYTDIETPSGITFGTITSTSIQLKSSNTPSGLTRGSSGLYIDSSAGQNSGWKQNNNYWTCSGLTPNYDTGFRIKARNGDGDETGYCTTIWKYTLANQPGVSSFSNITTDSIQVNWTSNGNYYYTDYYCENITTGQNSGWVNNTYTWNCTGLSSGTNYSFRVKARNSEGVETAWTALGSQMTHYSPVISTIEPNSGPVGTYMKIEGQYFYNSGSVIFAGGATGEILQWSDTTIYCRVPNGAQDGDTVVYCPTVYSNPVGFSVTDPAIIHVDDDYIPNIENGTLTYPFSKIERGIYSATASDMVVVYQGTFCENVNLDGKNITVTSLDPDDPNIAEVTIIDGSQNGPVVTFNSGEDANCVLTGFTITNGSANNGGGILCSSASPTITKNVITLNSADMGGGISCWNSTAKISNNTITDNTAHYSGGGIECYSSPLVITDNVIRNNSATNENGGGISCWSCSPAIATNTIIDNSAYDNGGGIFCYDANASISDCNISGNSAGGDGGGIYCENSAPNVTDTTITHCFALFGAGICSISSSPKVMNNVVFDNVATYGGGGIFCYGGIPLIGNNRITYNYHSGIYSYESSPTISNNIIAGNEGFLSGGIACDANSAAIIKNNTIVENWGQDSGGIGLDTGSTATVTNSIIWDNFTDTIENQLSLFYDEYFAKQTVLDINYSDVEHGFENVYLQDSNCTLTWGTGNISTDPCFVETGIWDANNVWWEGDYHLLSNSSCIDTGDPNYPEDANEFDIDGGTRVIGGRIDIGADEYTFGELSDFSGNGIVNFEDFAILAYYWKDYVCEEPDWCEGCDYDESGIVDHNDLRRFAENWLWQASWYSD